jgi:transposase
VLQETDAEKIARLEQENADLHAEIQRWQAESERLKRLLEEAVRAGKRQAAPFSRRNPKAHPNRPGRKPGNAYGRRCRRPIPEKIDETVDVPVPEQCPHCGGNVEEVKVVSQYQSEIPVPKVKTTEFRIHVGRCRQGKKRVQGRHGRQTSDATGGAASQLGPQALAWVSYLNKWLGLSCGKTTDLLAHTFGIKLSPGGLCQALQRVARKAEPSYQALVEKIGCEPSVTPDETGWKVRGQLWWMWAFVSSQVTVYAILPGRGFEQAAVVLGADFDRFLVRDGWGIYRQFTQAFHQTCVRHLLTRTKEMIEAAGVGEASARFPQQVQSILRAGLELRDRRDQGQISAHGLAVAVGRLQARMDRALQAPKDEPENRRLAKHLLREREALFPFLYCPGLEATNWRAEQAIRLMVVIRKVWGGNRTEKGAQTQSILGSILQTCRQQLRSFSSFVHEVLCSPQPKVIDLTAPHRSPLAATGAFHELSRDDLSITR